jgi:hypothetical protein
MSDTTSTLATNPGTALADQPAQAVTMVERERRLFFVAQKLLDGLSRRELIDLAMHCFKVGRRAAQKYVAVAERRLRTQEALGSPEFYFAVSKLQRDKLLERVFRQTNRQEEIEPQVLASLLTATNRLLDSRDRAALRYFSAAYARNGARPASAEKHGAEPHAAETLTRSESPRLESASPDAVPSRTNATEEQDGEEMDFSTVPPEIIGRLIILRQQGYSEQEAVEKVYAEYHVKMPEPNPPPAKDLQPGDWQV